ncbi:DUF6538 domain-containing protein [Bradyrhizobium symbiodeficiens]|uniref:DUF6538 domain-containing protein n=1 Tax=Bradyrhizobium symbiodeficiens TaxID=1404367 RepID=UPI003BAE8BE0
MRRFDPSRPSQKLQAVYYWRRRTPRALAKLLGRQHLSMSLQTTSRAAARRLAAQVNLFLMMLPCLLVVPISYHGLKSRQCSMLSSRSTWSSSIWWRSPPRTRLVSTPTRRGRTTGGPCGPTRCWTPKDTALSCVRRIATA